MEVADILKAKINFARLMKLDRKGESDLRLIATSNPITDAALNRYLTQLMKGSDIAPAEMVEDFIAQLMIAMDLGWMESIRALAAEVLTGNIPFEDESPLYETWFKEKKAELRKKRLPNKDRYIAALASEEPATEEEFE